MARTSCVLSSCLMLAFLAACGAQPVGPSPSLPAEPGLNAKPPGSAVHTVSFGPVAVDTDGILPGHIESSAQTMTGSITGTESAGTLRAVMSGSYTWSISDVNNLGGTGNACTASEKQLLIDRGLIGPGSSISGTLTFDANQKTSSGQRVDLSMTGITDNTGAPWAIGGNSTINFEADISGDANSVTVIMETFVIGFKLNPRGKVAADLTIGCRVDFTATLVTS